MDHRGRHSKKLGKSGNRQRFHSVSDRFDREEEHSQNRKRVPYRRDKKQRRDFLPVGYGGTLQDWEDHEI